MLSLSQKRSRPIIHALRALSVASAFLACRASGLAEDRDDLGWLKSKGTLIFSESFEREETGNDAKAIGNGWNSATADRVPQIKQSDLDMGILKIHSATKEAGHAAHIHHEIGFEDGGAWIRFKLPGLADGEVFQVGYVDRECKSVHAGHLCYAIFNSATKTLSLRDAKTGGMDLEIRKRSERERNENGKVSAELQQLLKSKEKTVPWTPDHEWHDLVLATEGNELRVSMDGKLVAQFQSEGFAHPMKRWLSFLVPSYAWVDEVKVWKVK
jgi:hypothetical protein